jgi:hypothetical protein
MSRGNPPMSERPMIECDIHGLLNEAGTVLLGCSSDSERLSALAGRAREIISKLRNCAQQAKTAGYLASERQLRQSGLKNDWPIGSNSSPRDLVGG